MNNDRYKILTVIIILAVLVAGIIVVRSRTKRASDELNSTDATQITETKSVQENAPISADVKNIVYLSAEKENYQKDEDIIVSAIFTAPGKKIFGTDLVILYDPGQVVTHVESIEKGIFFANFPRITVDEENGIIKISGYQGSETELGTDNYEIVNIKFRAIKIGRGKIELSFAKGETNATTLVEAATSQNILEKVENFNFEIKE